MPAISRSSQSSGPTLQTADPILGEQKAKKQEENEVWLIDFGLAGKTRPALVVSVAFGDRDRSLITAVLRATSLRGSPFGIATLQAQKRRP